MSSPYFDYYDGSKLFQGLATRIGLPLDLVSINNTFSWNHVVALCLVIVAHHHKSQLIFAQTTHYSFEIALCSRFRK